MSQISREPLRTTYWVVQIGSRLARLACGTKRSTLLSAARDSRGAARAPDAATPAVCSNARRFTPLAILIPSLLLVCSHAPSPDHACAACPSARRNAIELVLIFCAGSRTE